MNIFPRKSSYFYIMLLCTFLIAVFFIVFLSLEVKSLKKEVKNTGLSEQKRLETNNQQNIQKNIFSNNNVPKPDSNDHIRGNINASYALVEYSDFDCSYCKEFQETAKDFISETGNETMWVYRHLPIKSLHPFSETKSIASECAYLQGGDEAFWKYADLLYENQDQKIGNKEDLDSLLKNIALESNLNMERFNDCLISNSTKDRVGKDVSSAKAAQVVGTPGTYLINLNTGKTLTLNGSVPLNVLLNALKIIKG